MTDRMSMNDRCDDVFNSRHAPRALDDSDRNILADLAHEGCEDHCDECGRCDWEPTGPMSTRTVPMTTVNGRTLCEDCLTEPSTLKGNA